jgi:RNA polymerase sigma factor (sigma-70 family)
MLTGHPSRLGRRQKYGSICNPGDAGQRPMYPVEHDTIIQRILDGDSRAYAELVRHYQRMVYTVCMRVLRNTEDAEEATQDSFVKAYQHLAAFGGKAKFSTWLYSIAYRTAISQGRKRRNEENSVDELPHHPASAPDTTGHRNELRQLLDSALARLDPEDASILSFYHLEELSVEEIVTITGLGASNVKVRLHRARKKLLDVIQATHGPEAQRLILEYA